MTLNLATPASEISRVGKTTAGRLKILGIETVLDLIFYYPFRWQDLSEVSEIANLRPGEIFTIKAKIQLINNRRSFAKKRNLTEALVADKTGSLKVIWFNQPYLAKVLAPGEEVYLSGKVDFDRYTLQLINPVYEKAGQSAAIHLARIVPIYSLTGNLTQKQIRFLIKMSMPAIKLIKDWLPQELLEEFNLLGLHQALNQIHFPQSQKILDLAIRRLKFNELFLFQAQIALSRQEIASSQAEVINFAEAKTKEFVQSLPFTLTDDQRKVAWQILSDLSKAKPMNRLLAGDVGCGKTVVAALAAFNAALNQKQAVVMAPTEILASQHYKNISQLLKSAGLEIALLTHSQQLLSGETVTKNKILKELKAGKIQIIIGTHALIQEKIEFQNLALAVIDEQHRFGVGQRKILREKSGNPATTPHLLSLTATPIPRSLALTLYGDLDLSLIREMPKERKKVITEIAPPADRERVYEFIRQEIKSGRQAFVICPLIDLSDKLGVKAVTTEAEILAKEIFPDLRIALLHGKLKPEKKEQIMADFLARESDILVSTSVVEVGVDVPNATVMLIEGVERFGLAQLHQFRGRVGRASWQSYCFLFTENKNEKTKARLDALVTAKDGFELAEFDLKFRGPGEIYGTRQSGWLDFKIARITDAELIAEAKQAVEKVMAAGLENYPDLQEKVKQLVEKVHFE